jgi:hypothetical protein
MNFPNDKYELALATAQDVQEIKSVFESGEFDGRIAVQFLRNPDPITSFEKEGEKVFLLVLKDKPKNKLIGIGACIIRKVVKRGEIVRMGYLAGLKIIPEYQRKVLFISQIYQQLQELTKEKADFYFSTILKENTLAQKLLEKPRKGMPLYEYLGDYRVYFCKSGIRNRLKLLLTKDEKYTARRCRSEELSDFYACQAMRSELSLEDIAAYDLKNAQFYGLFCQDTLVACGYVLNQQNYKQYVVKKYGGVYRLLSKLPTRLMGYPSFPKAGETANCACAGIWADGNNEMYVHKLWQFMKQDAVEFDFLMLGLHKSHPLRAYFEKTKQISYDSRCYVVDYEANKEVYEELSNKELYIDVAFL